MAAWDRVGGSIGIGDVMIAVGGGRSTGGPGLQAVPTGLTSRTAGLHPLHSRWPSGPTTGPPMDSNKLDGLPFPVTTMAVERGGSTISSHKSAVSPASRRGRAKSSTTRRSTRSNVRTSIVRQRSRCTL